MSLRGGSDILPYAADETDGDHAAPSSVVVYVCGFGCDHARTWRIRGRA